MAVNPYLLIGPHCQFVREDFYTVRVQFEKGWIPIYCTKCSNRLYRFLGGDCDGLNYTPGENE